MTRKRIPRGRLCISLPVHIIETYRDIHAETNMSISALVLLDIKNARKKSKVLLLPTAYIKELQNMEAIVEAVRKDNNVSAEAKIYVDNLMQAYRQRNDFVWEAENFGST